MSNSASYKRTQVGIDLLLQRSGQESQTLAGFHRGPRQNNAVHLLVQQRGDGHGNRQVRLAGAGRPDAEHHVMALDRFQIAALIRTLGLDCLPAKRTLASGFGQSTQGDVRVADQHAQHAVQVAVLKLEAGPMQVVVVGEQLLGAGHVARRAFQVDVIGTQVDVDVQAVFEHVQVFIASAEQGHEVRTDFNAFLHSELWRRLPQLGARCLDVLYRSRNMRCRFLHAKKFLWSGTDRNARYTGRG